jgi:XTP/dITP diphosphohydrolase
MLHKKIVLATHNLHKQKEMDSILSSLGILIVGLDDFPQIGDIEETGTTLLENAFIKAHAVHQLTGLPAIADDTGLEVDALDGAPGVYSARYAGRSPTFKENCDKLLFELKKCADQNRDAKFRTVIVFVDKEMKLQSEGVVKGVIVKKPRGIDGFGYDPIFKPNSYDSTFAEMEMEEKNRISHRAKALIKMKEILVPYLK